MPEEMALLRRGNGRSAHGAPAAHVLNIPCVREAEFVKLEVPFAGHHEEADGRATTFGALRLIVFVTTFCVVINRILIGAR